MLRIKRLSVELSPSVRHRLEAAGADEMVALRGAAVLLRSCSPQGERETQALVNLRGVKEGESGVVVVTGGAVGGGGRLIHGGRRRPLPLPLPLGRSERLCGRRRPEVGSCGQKQLADLVPVAGTLPAHDHRLAAATHTHTHTQQDTNQGHKSSERFGFT